MTNMIGDLSKQNKKDEETFQIFKEKTEHGLADQKLDIVKTGVEIRREYQ